MDTLLCKCWWHACNPRGEIWEVNLPFLSRLSFCCSDLPPNSGAESISGVGQSSAHTPPTGGFRNLCFWEEWAREKCLWDPSRVGTWIFRVTARWAPGSPWFSARTCFRLEIPSEGWFLGLSPGWGGCGSHCYIVPSSLLLGNMFLSCALYLEHSLS